jgi:hypothetical protein
MCSQEDHVMENALKRFEEEKSFEGDTLFWVLLFSLK